MLAIIKPRLIMDYRVLRVITRGTKIVCVFDCRCHCYIVVCAV